LSILYIGDTTPLKMLQEELAETRGYHGWLSSCIPSGYPA
jgi:hypothetical protein